jgi:hypothetical protein
MADITRWRNWKPTGTGLTKPVGDPGARGFVGFVSFVSSGTPSTDDPRGEPQNPVDTAQTKENKNAAFRCDLAKDQAPEGFVSFGGFVSRHPLPDAAADPRWMSWAERKAEMLNRLFLEQGVTGRRGRITAETVLHGERKRREQLLK